MNHELENQSQRHWVKSALVADKTGDNPENFHNNHGGCAMYCALCWIMVVVLCCTDEALNTFQKCLKSRRLR